MCNYKLYHHKRCSCGPQIDLSTLEKKNILYRLNFFSMSLFSVYIKVNRCTRMQVYFPDFLLVVSGTYSVSYTLDVGAIYMQLKWLDISRLSCPLPGLRMHGASPPRPIYIWHIFMYRSNCSILSGSVCSVGEYRSENYVTLFFCI